MRFATEDAYLGDDQLFTYSSSLAMGLASLCALHLHAPLMQLAVWDGVVNDGAIADTAADMSAWRKAGHPVTIVPVGPDADVKKLPPWHRPKVARGRRDTRAMLFGDIHGFSKLTDAQLPAFAVSVMGTLVGGSAPPRSGNIATFVNTWGDGIFVVFRNADRAAACALDMQDAMSAIDFKAAGAARDAPSYASAAIWGPSMELNDPITDRPNYYGAHVSRAARIEPITPEGCVYVTETFAAVLALHDAGLFLLDYVGNTEMARHYGRLRMFLLRRARWQRPSRARGYRAWGGVGLFPDLADLLIEPTSRRRSGHSRHLAAAIVSAQGRFRARRVKARTLNGLADPLSATGS